MSNTSTRRLLIDLISTLNASFPDYDFSVVSPDSFSSQELGSTMQRVNSFLAELTIQTPGFIQDMWRAIDSVRHDAHHSYKQADSQLRKYDDYVLVRIIIPA
jgi:hypothetical protein